MGVDASMYVVVPTALSDHAIERVAVEMQCRFRNAGLRTSPTGQYRADGLPYHCLERADPYPEKILEHAHAGRAFTVLYVLWWQSYYGPNYERGDLPEILAVARFLRGRWNSAEVWYGGDDRVELLDARTEAALWRHFVGKRGVDYFATMGHRGLSQLKMRCDHCDIELACSRVSADQEGWYCVSCGRHWTVEYNKPGQGGIHKIKEMIETLPDYATKVGEPPREVLPPGARHDHAPARTDPRDPPRRR